MSVPTQRPPYHVQSKRPIYDMDLPFNPNTLKQTAEARGLGRQGAAVFAHLALQQLRSIQDEQVGTPVSAEQVAAAIKRHAMAQLERDKATQGELEQQGVSISADIERELMLYDEHGEKAAEEEDKKVTVEEGQVDGLRKKRFKFSRDGLHEFFGGGDPYGLGDQMAKLSLKHSSSDIITALCHNVELAVELGKHLRPQDLLNLYIANTVFRQAIAGHLLSSIRSWISYKARDAGQIFSFKLYRRHLVLDPAGRTWGEQYGGLCSQLPVHKRNEVRSIPGLRYLQLVVGRDRYCREIVAIMARNGHRMPETMHGTLLRLWLLMDIATTGQRQAMLGSTVVWTDEHVYNAQLLFVKLGMHFNDPVYGPNSYELLHLILGQKGLYPLWQLLMRKNYTRLSELMELKVRYDFELPPDHWGHDYFEQKVYNVPFEEVGLGHLEGWGRGRKHLMRPDELIPAEAVTRGLELDEHIVHMMIWGYFNWETGENIVPTEEELYVSDEETALAHMDTMHHWRPRHALKKRFDELTPEEQQDIVDDDEDERLRAMAWSGNGDDGDDDDDDDDKDYDCDSSDEGPHSPHTYTLDDEIDRGYMLQPQAKDKPSTAPALDDARGWASFVDTALLGMPPEVGEDEKLRAQAWQSYQHPEYQSGWDWERWLAREEGDSADVERGGDEYESEGGDDGNGSDNGDEHTGLQIEV